MTMDLKTKKTGNCIIINLPDNIDMIMSSELEKNINTIFNEEANANFIMNLKDVTIISSSGLRIFITARRKLREVNKEIVLCNIDNEAVVETFKAAKLLDIFSVFSNENDAIAHFK